MDNKKSIITENKFKLALRNIGKVVSLYIGLAAIMILFAIPTKLLFKLLQLVWNLI